MLGQLINLGSCSQLGIICTGANYCELDIKELKSVWFAPYGYKFPTNIQNANQLTLAQLQDEVIALNIVPKGGIKSVAYTTEENRLKTYSGGEKAVVGKNPIQLDLTFEGGIQNYQAWVTLEKRTKHSVFLIDSNGTIFVVKNKQGLVGAINCDFLTVEPYKGFSGSEGGDFMVKMQLDRNQFDTEFGGLQIDNMDFNAVRDLNCLAEVVPMPTSVEISGDNLLIFKVKQLADQHDVAGLDQDKMEIKINGDGEDAIDNGLFTEPTPGTYQFERNAGIFDNGFEVKITIKPQYVGELGYKGSSEFVVI